jgi:hypothetical protein
MRHGRTPQPSAGRQPVRRWKRTISATTSDRCGIVAPTVASSTGFIESVSCAVVRPRFNPGMIARASGTTGEHSPFGYGPTKNENYPFHRSVNVNYRSTALHTNLAHRFESHHTKLHGRRVSVWGFGDRLPKRCRFRCEFRPVIAKSGESVRMLVR